MRLFGLDYSEGSLEKKDPMSLREALLQTLDEVERLLAEPFEDASATRTCDDHEPTTGSSQGAENTRKPAQ